MNVSDHPSIENTTSDNYRLSLKNDSTSFSEVLKLNKDPEIEFAGEVVMLLAQGHSNEAKRTLNVIRDLNITNDVFWVSNGEEALSFLFNRGFNADRYFYHRPKLLILDFDIPKLSGLELLKRIRANEKTKNMNVIASVSSIEEKKRLEAYHLNISAYLLKPIDHMQFKNKLLNTDFSLLAFFWKGRRKQLLYAPY